MRLGIDIDGVLANFEACYAPLLTKHTGIEFSKLGQPDWPDTWYWERDAGVTKEQESAVWEEIKSTHYWRTLPSTPECAETLEFLQDYRNCGHEIYFVTSRPGGYALGDTIDWLEDQGFTIPHVIIANSAEEKGQIAREIGLHFFLDDKPSNCLAVAEHASTYLLDRPWNRTWDNDKEAILRVSHPVDALDHFFAGLDR